MKKNEVKVGKFYTAKVTGHMATIRIDAENPRGGWDGTNITTGKKIRIKSAQRLRCETRSPASATRAKKPTKASKDAKVPAKPNTPKRGGITEANKTDVVNVDKKKRSSGLDAAATILADATEPLNTKEMVTQMLASGVWSTNGKTPAATIYAAIIREISTKGDAARFRKADRGKFELAR